MVEVDHRCVIQAQFTGGENIEQQFKCRVGQVYRIRMIHQCEDTLTVFTE